MTPLNVTMEQVAAIRAHLAGEGDEQLYADMLEGSTDLHEWVRYLLDKIEEDEGATKVLAEQIGDRQARKSQAGNRIERRREAIQAFLECAGIDKLTLPEATLSVRKVAPKAVVTDEAAVPEHLCRVKRSPDMAAIKAEVEAGRAVSGVSFDNGGTSLAVRRK